MKTKIVLIGAGSAQFGLGMLSDIFQSKILYDSHITLHDINTETLKDVESKAVNYIKENNLPFTIDATTSREKALEDAKFCIISIEVGNRFELWEQDWRIPQQYGIRQVYGENGGPGGLFHSLRIIPPILEICEDISKIAPDAFVFNYSNPMSRICTTVNRRFPQLKFVGLCHEIFSLHTHLPKILNTSFENLSIRAGGLNHFSVLLEAKYKDSGDDAYPEIRKKAPVYFENLLDLDLVANDFFESGKWPSSDNKPYLKDKTHKWPERGVFKVILEKFGYLPITTDSHFGEYIQWAHDVCDHKGIIDFYNHYKNWTLTQNAEIKPKLTERVIPIIEAILTNNCYEELAVNLPNKGLIDNLPEFIAVEVPAIINKDGLTGVKLGTLPHGIAGLLTNQIAIHDLTAETVLTGSRDIALQALLVDPIVDKAKNAELILDTMLNLQKDYLGYIK